MTPDEAQNYREGFKECLDILWGCFMLTAHLPEDKEVITIAIEAKNKAHELLAEVVQERKEE